MKKFNKNALALATVAMLATGISSQAHAGAVAYSYLNIYDFTIKNSNGTTFDVITDMGGVLSGGNSSSNLGSLDSVASLAATNAGLSFAGIDAALACQGDCDNTLAGQNIFIQTAVGDHFSRGDSSLTGAIIESIPFAPAPANAKTVAEVQLTSTDGGNSSAAVGTTTGFTFSLNQADFIQFDFDATLDLYAELHPEALNGSATGKSGFSITITGDEDGLGVKTLFSWTPDGIVQIDGTDGVWSETDVCDLTQTATTTSPGTSSNETCGGGAYLAQTKILTSGIQYSLAIDHNSVARANVVKKVPEPASLVLFGMSLLGFGVARRINSKT